MGSYAQLVVSGGKQVGRVVTHRREKFKENPKKVASKNYQEIRGGTSNNIIQKARHAVSAHKTLIFCRIYDNEESQRVFNKEGVGGCDMDTERLEGRTIY